MAGYHRLASGRRLGPVLSRTQASLPDHARRLLAGRTEEEVFGSEVPAPADPPTVSGTPAERPSRDAPRPLPRPGFGTAE